MLKLIFGLIGIAMMVILGTATADAQCLQKATVQECMKCVQKKGDAGSSGGLNWCSKNLKPSKAQKKTG